VILIKTLNIPYAFVKVKNARVVFIVSCAATNSNILRQSFQITSMKRCSVLEASL
jgi:hypothetical protein